MPSPEHYQNNKSLIMTQYLFELIGTLVLVLLGDGVCAACSLNKC